MWCGFVASHFLPPTSCFVFVAHVAQSAEHFLGKEEVTGSIPVMGL
jgi:hypothetical protein